MTTLKGRASASQWEDLVRWGLREQDGACALALEDVGNLGGVGVEEEDKASDGNGELGVADGGGAEYGQHGW
ncbi:hypothetical protein OsI_15610 [Oryza sativa Indica Group]|uniref:Uncharacterized protein n=1 Tax=Oryza sativa subsp. indica TaxID=39946 RepID=A2XSM0_ORYSI|nr:hypothetical protein OsI_15610 [Oryza sativa Indica Group]